MSCSGMGRDVHPEFPLPTTTSPTLQGARRMVLERLSWRVTCPNRASFRLFDSCQKRLLWTNKEVDLAPDPVVDWSSAPSRRYGEVSSCTWFRKSGSFFFFFFTYTFIRL